MLICLTMLTKAGISEHFWWVGTCYLSGWSLIPAIDFPQLSNFRFIWLLTRRLAWNQNILRPVFYGWWSLSIRSNDTDCFECNEWAPSMGTDDDWPVARSDPQRKEENFTRPRGLGGKRPQRPRCRWNHPQGIPAESAFFGCTFGARTKGWRYYWTLRVPAVIGLLAKGIFGNNSRNEGNYFVFCYTVIF